MKPKLTYRSRGAIANRKREREKQRESDEQRRALNFAPTKSFVFNFSLLFYIFLFFFLKKKKTKKKNMCVCVFLSLLFILCFTARYVVKRIRGIVHAITLLNCSSFAASTLGFVWVMEIGKCCVDLDNLELELVKS